MASINTLKNWGMGLVILGIMFGIGLAVLGDVQDTLYEDEEEEQGEAYHGVGDAVEGLSEFTGWFPLIALVVVAAVIITLVQSGFGNAGGHVRERYSRA